MNMEIKMWKWVGAVIFFLLLTGCTQREHEYFRIEGPEKIVVMRNFCIKDRMSGDIVFSGTDSKGVEQEMILKPGQTYKIVYLDVNRMAEDARP
jgi:hypothetical protein